MEYNELIFNTNVFDSNELIIRKNEETIQTKYNKGVIEIYLNGSLEYRRIEPLINAEYYKSFIKKYLENFYLLNATNLNESNINEIEYINSISTNKDETIITKYENGVKSKEHFSNTVIEKIVDDGDILQEIDILSNENVLTHVNKFNEQVHETVYLINDTIYSIKNIKFDEIVPLFERVYEEKTNKILIK